MVVVPKNTSLNVRISGSVDPEISIDPNTTSATVDLSVAIPPIGSSALRDGTTFVTDSPSNPLEKMEPEPLKFGVNESSPAPEMSTDTL